MENVRRDAGAHRPIRTERLEMIPGGAEIFAAELDGREALARSLGARVPASWPPELFDEDAMRHYAGLLDTHADTPGWLLWYLLLPGNGPEPPVAVGLCGFKGQPAPDGTVEMGYSVLEPYQRAGYATEAVAALVEWAFSHDTVSRILGETYPHLTPSIRVLEKNGFRESGPGSEEGVVCYELRRPAPGADEERDGGRRPAAQP